MIRRVLAAAAATAALAVIPVVGAQTAEAAACPSGSFCVTTWFTNGGYHDVTGQLYEGCGEPSYQWGARTAYQQFMVFPC